MAGAVRRSKRQLPAGVVGSQRELAEAIGVSPRTIEGWRQSGMPRRDDGTYSIADVLRWKQERDEALQAAKRQKSAAADIGDGIDPSELKLPDRKIYWEAKKTEQQVKAMLQKAMPIPHVEQLLRDRAAGMRKEMLALSRRLAPRCEGKRQAEIRKVLDEAFGRLLDGYAAEVASK